MVGGLFLPLGPELTEKSFSEQAKAFKEMVAEADAAYMIVLEASAAGGMFTISFSHRFTNDAYLDAFLDELRGQNLTCEIADRHPLKLAPIADYRNF